MLNLLKFRDLADYSGHEDIRPEEAISGKEAYNLYIEHTLPELDKVGSKLLFHGVCQPYLIGPEGEGWDAMLLVEHESAEAFVAFAQNEDYLKFVGHRTAALEDARLVPMTAIASLD